MLNTRIFSCGGKGIINKMLTRIDLYKKILLAVFILYSAVSFADSDYYKGLWLYSINVEIAGMGKNPDLKKIEYCIKELNELISLFKPDPACAVYDVKNSEPNLSWALNCKTNKGNYRGKTKLTRSNGVIKGKLDMFTDIPGLSDTLTTTYKIRGKYKGPC